MSRSVAKSHNTQENTQRCLNCMQDLSLEGSRVLFVEEEVGRIFCSETCIVGYFSPEIKKLEKEYFKWLQADDLDDQERKDLSNLRWSTLKRPDEVWKERTRSGDARFTLITQYKRNHKPIWYICLCLFLRGEPSFLYLAFPTQNEEMIDHYRRGERMRGHWHNHNGSDDPRKIQKLKSNKKKKDVSKLEKVDQEPNEDIEIIQMDGLATEWTQEETLMAQLVQNRNKDDIPPDEFKNYSGCVNDTLELPDEIWFLSMENSVKLIHFIKHFSIEIPIKSQERSNDKSHDKSHEANSHKEIWYIVIARQIEKEEGIEILDAFPTRDPHLVECYRKGEQQVGVLSLDPASKIVH